MITEREVEVEHRVNLVARAKRIFELILNSQRVKCAKPGMMPGLLIAIAVHFPLYQEVKESRIKYCRRKCPAVN